MYSVMIFSVVIVSWQFTKGRGRIFPCRVPKDTKASLQDIKGIIVTIVCCYEGYNANTICIVSEISYFSPPKFSHIDLLKPIS